MDRKKKQKEFVEIVLVVKVMEEHDVFCNEKGWGNVGVHYVDRKNILQEQYIIYFLIMRYLTHVPWYPGWYACIFSQ